MKRNITKDFIIVALVVVLGKILGFARELVVSYLYGSSAITDAFYYVNGIITALLAIVTMGLGQAFTPTYIDLTLKESKKSANIFTNKILTILLGIGLLLTVVIALFPRTCINLLAPNMDKNTAALSADMMRIMIVSFPVYIAFSIRKCILNSNHKYVVTEASGIPYSLAITLITFMLFRSIGDMALPIAAVVGVISQLIFTFLFSRKDYLFRPDLRIVNDRNVTDYFKLLIPIFVCAVMEEANGLIRRSLAGEIATGAIANLSYCMNLTALVNGIVIASLSTVFFPSLIRDYSENNIEGFQKNMDKCLSITSVLVIPIIAFLAVFSKDVVRIIYQRGEFLPSDTEVVASLFSIYIVGTIVYAYRYIIRNAFYATKNVKLPMINEIVYLLICIACNVFQVKVLHLDLDALGIAWVISITLTTPFLFISFKKKYFPVFTRSMGLETLKAAVCAVIATVATVYLGNFTQNMNLYLNMALLLSGFVVIYVVAMYICKSHTLKDVLHSFAKAKQ